MQRLTRSQLQHYGVAVIAVVIAFLLTQILWWLIKPSLYPLFLAAVMVSSWYGGIGPGLLSTALAVLICTDLLIPSIDFQAASRANVIGLFQFVLVALLISFLNAKLRSTQRRAEINAQEAQRNYQSLLQSRDIIRQSEERYRLLVEGATEYAIFMLDTSGNIISWNIGAERILGYQEAEILGQHFARIFTPEAIERGQPQQALKKAVAEGFSRENRWHVRKDGTHLWTHCVITALHDGSLRGFAKIMQDITGRKQAEAEREQLLVREQAARSEAEAANRSKDEFLAIVSHELRTPMTAILGWAGMLQAGILDEDKAAIAIETIERNANLQMQLIEDLLDISRIIRGELSLDCRIFDVVEAITSAIEVVQPMANAKAMDFRFSILDFRLGSTGENPEFISYHEIENNPKSRSFAQTPPQGQATGSEIQNPKFLVWGDSDRLQQVVLNLLSNAIKFTPVGGRVEVRLSVEGSRGEARGERLVSKSLLPADNSSSYLIPQASYPGLFACIQVIDTGKGISADFLPYVFDRFRQADSKSTRSQKGLGLGLAIAQHIVEMHGGTISAQSQGVGQGSTFTVKIPLVEKAREAEGYEQAGGEIPLAPKHSDTAPSLKGLQVLVVDDEVDTREWIVTILKQSGAEAQAVGSVGEALEALENFKPDVLVSDIGMPGEDGYTLIRKIRQLEPETGGRIPAVALTGYARVEDYRAALAAGFQLHVAKPIRAAELIAVIASLATMSKESD
ncbi:MAG TPA: ATP-binding protein [Leptolyngbyaceae cyanobacterium]